MSRLSTVRKSSLPEPCDSKDNRVCKSYLVIRHREAALHFIVAILATKSIVQSNGSAVAKVHCNNVYFQGPANCGWGPIICVSLFEKALNLGSMNDP